MADKPINLQRLQRRGRQSSNRTASRITRDLELHMLRLLRYDRDDGGLGDDRLRDEQRQRFLQAQDRATPERPRRPNRRY